MKTNKTNFRIFVSAFIFSLSFILASCEKVVEFDIDETERAIVVNALPNTDSLLFVNITYSRFFLDNGPFEAVTNASVTVDVNGIPYTSTQRDGANYLFSYRSTAGDTLTLHVNIPGHESITGTTIIPPLPDMPTPVAEIDTLQPIDSGDILISLSDPSEMENYYYIYLTERDSGIQWNMFERKWDTIDTVIHPYFNCLNHEITNADVNVSEGMMDYFNSLLFSDRQIDGQTYEIKLSLMMLKDTAEHPLLKEYSLVVESLSPEAFRYIKEVNASQSMTQYFAEPTQIFSNLSSGIGIFAGIARREYPLTFTYKESTE
ncbi:MAG: DUF4249 domain-containing protein [Bacteroidales bacterium]|nr:DUF4249 domain-containing protein [Bacteroidales bacterium]